MPGVVVRVDLRKLAEAHKKIALARKAIKDGTLVLQLSGSVKQLEGCTRARACRLRRRIADGSACRLRRRIADGSAVCFVSPDTTKLSAAAACSHRRKSLRAEEYSPDATPPVTPRHERTQHLETPTAAHPTPRQTGVR